MLAEPTEDGLQPRRRGGTGLAGRLGGIEGSWARFVDTVEKGSWVQLARALEESSWARFAGAVEDGSHISGVVARDCEGAVVGDNLMLQESKIEAGGSVATVRRAQTELDGAGRGRARAHSGAGRQGSGNREHT
ncbi:hypothetical protein PR202_ga03654 [Eleusine coracana subsp. coracana]|uniref:Uncharacterized protein n=1 Tax=Eleusine coracana subsp. coracana TaxID=191504 RepID=A0AAV5BMI9_ELECO|nr:hypothetical protein PR202_ga03654 [Eleusine coracana subsp. coracana]